MIADAGTLTFAVIAWGYVVVLTLATVGGLSVRRRRQSRARLDDAASRRRLREEMARHG